MGHKGSKIATASLFKEVNGTFEPQNATGAQTTNFSVGNPAYSNNSSLGLYRSCIVENFVVVWLDLTVSEEDVNTQKSIIRLRRIVNSVKIFTNPFKCFDYLVKLRHEKVFLIVPGEVGQQLVSKFSSEISQLASIYVFCDNKSQHQRWTRYYRQVKGVFTRIETLYDALKDDVCRYENDLTSINIVTSSSATTFNELGLSFIYSLLKENLLENEPHHQAKKVFVDFCRCHYANNNEQLKVIDEFEQKYPHPSPVWWFTRLCFISTMLNKALRAEDVDIIIKMGFILRGLHQQIKELHSQEADRHPLTVYHRQGLSYSEFEQIKESKGGLLVFRNLLSASTNRDVSFNVARYTRENADLTAIVFLMEIDPSVSTIPFVSLDNISYLRKTRKMIRFSMHTIFRIEEIKQIDDRLWQVNLTLTSDNDQQVTRIIQHMREINKGPITGLYRMGELELGMGEFDKAEEIFKRLIETLPDNNREELSLIHDKLGCINSWRGNLTGGLFHYQRSIDIFLTFKSSNDPQLSTLYSNIGHILQKQVDLDDALKYFERALNIHLYPTLKKL